MVGIALGLMASLAPAAFVYVLWASLRPPAGGPESFLGRPRARRWSPASGTATPTAASAEGYSLFTDGVHLGDPAADLVADLLEERLRG